MDDKLELKEILALIDTKSSNAWAEFSDNQKKNIRKDFYILNRYISSSKTNNSDLQELLLTKTNAYYNNHWNELQSHPELLWKLLCACPYNSSEIMYHEWIGLKKGKSNKIVKFLEMIYPIMKQDEIELLAIITPLDDLKALAKDHGYDNKQIAAFFK
jgi:hypothetical protein